VGALATAQYAVMALAFVQGIVAARFLGVKEYGTLALILAYPGVVLGFLQLGTERGCVKFLAQFAARGETERAAALCRFSLATDLLLSCLGFVVVSATASYADEHLLRRSDLLAPLLIYSASYIPKALAATSRAVLSAQDRFTAVAAVEAVLSAGRALAVILLTVQGRGIGPIIWAYAVQGCLSGLCATVLAARAFGEAWKTSWMKGHFRSLRGVWSEIASFWFYQKLDGLFGIVTKGLDVVLVGALLGPVETGYYRLAKSVSEAPLLMVSSVSSVTYTRLARLWGAGNSAEFRRFVGRVSLWVGLPLSLLICLAIPAAKPLVVLFAGPAYADAAPIMTVLLLSTSLSQLTFCLPLLNLIWAQTRFVFFNKALFALLRFYGFLYFARFGAVGIGQVLLATNVVGAVVSGAWLLLQGRRAARLDLERKLASQGAAPSVH
jgi:stage V sporulation protein B